MSAAWPGYRVLVSDRTHHGRRKLHTFVVHTAGERWCREPDIAKAVRGQFDRGQGTPRNPVDLAEAGMLRTPLADVEHLAPGVDVSGPTLAFIFEALASGGRHEVDLKDLNRIVSQLGSLIARTAALAEGGARQQAEAALFAEILRRCTTV